MEPESSLPYSQAPATCPYPEPTPSSPHNPFPLLEDQSFWEKKNTNRIVTVSLIICTDRNILQIYYQVSNSFPCVLW